MAEVAPPTAAPGTAPTPVPSSAFGVNIAPPALSSGGKKKSGSYGLTDAQAKVYLGPLAPQLGFTAPDGMVSTQDALNAFAAANPQLQAQIQSMLRWAGFYTSAGTKNITLGRVTDTDLKAFAQSMNMAVTVTQGVNTYNQQHPDAPRKVEDYANYFSNLQDAASQGQTNGIQAAINSRVATLAKAQESLSSSVINIQHYNRDQVYTVADRIGERLLGRSLSDAEKASIYADLGAKNAATVAKEQAKASLLGKDITEAETAGQNLNTALTGRQGGNLMPNSQMAPLDPNFVGPALPGTHTGMSPLQTQAFEQANQAAPVSVDTYLDAMRKTADDPNNPYGFTPTTWSAYARLAGLGSDATMSAGNQEIVARYLAMNMYARYGSWAAVTTGFLKGPSAAAQYALNPNSATWTRPSSTGATVAARVSAIGNVLATTGAPQLNGLRADLGDVTPGFATGKASKAAALALSGTGTGPQVIDTEAMPFSPDDIVEQKIKQSHPTEYQAHNLANSLGNFLNLLGGVNSQNISGYGPSGVPS